MAEHNNNNVLQNEVHHLPHCEKIVVNGELIETLTILPLFQNIYNLAQKAEGNLRNGNRGNRRSNSILRYLILC